MGKGERGLRVFFDKQPAYDPSLWSERPEFAATKLSDVEGVIETRTLYPPLVDLLVRCRRWDDTILDVGCAGGHFWRTLEYEIKEGIKPEYTGCDITPAYIEVARARFPEKNWLVADARKLPFADKSFDWTLCLFLLLHLDDTGRQKALEELRRVTRRQILLSAYFSTVRVPGHCDGFIYDIVSLDELQAPGWGVDVVAEPKPLHFPSQVKTEGKWVDGVAEIPIYSYARLVRKVG